MCLHNLEDRSNLYKSIKHRNVLDQLRNNFIQLTYGFIIDSLNEIKRKFKDNITT